MAATRTAARRRAIAGGIARRRLRAHRPDRHMKLTVFFDHVFVRDRDGRHYTRAAFDAAFWSRYLKVFDALTVVARAQPVDALPPGVTPADRDDIQFVELPPYAGPWGYLMCRSQVRRTVAACIADAQAVILRVPSTIGTLAWRKLREARRPFGVEVVADPAETLAAGGVRSLARPIARASQIRAMRAQCAEACAAAYVSRESLQRAYPPGNPHCATHYSSIDLRPEDLLDAPRTDFSEARRLVHVGTLETLYKAQDVLLRAVARCRRPDLRLTFVGDGRRRPDMERLADELGIRGQVTFAGRLPAGKAVRDVLDASDLFVLPSRTEGLPRAMIEAMARGLPCVGTHVGGIPELLDDAQLVAAGSVESLAVGIIGLISAPDELRRLAARNLAVARGYTAEVLELRRERFYSTVRDACAGHARRQGSGC